MALIGAPGNRRADYAMMLLKPRAIENPLRRGAGLPGKGFFIHALQPSVSRHDAATHRDELCGRVVADRREKRPRIPPRAGAFQPVHIDQKEVRGLSSLQRTDVASPEHAGASSRRHP